jgi:hypothetical protein
VAMLAAGPTTGGVMMRVTAPVGAQPPPRSPFGPHTPHAFTVRDLRSPGFGNHSLGGGRASQRRSSVESAASGTSSQPRLRRVATVSGTDRYELVDFQTNELLQLLLVMDVRRTGSISYEDWTRGVLSQPEVLACFQLASFIAQPRPTRPGAQSFERYGASSPTRDRHGSFTRGTDTAGALAQSPPAPPLSTVSTALWWRSFKQALQQQLACVSCSRQA